MEKIYPPLKKIIGYQEVLECGHRIFVGLDIPKKSNRFCQKCAKKKHNNYVRIGKFQLDEVLPYVVFGNPNKIKDQAKQDLEYRKQVSKEYMGRRVKMYSWRYQLFATKGIKCVRCGLEGEFFILEKNGGNPPSHIDSFHFNLYAIDESSEEVLMTKDHIVPASKGGRNWIDNFQTMCTNCNTKKGNTKEPQNTNEMRQGKNHVIRDSYGKTKEKIQS